MTLRTDHHSDFELGHLTLYGAAAIVLLIYAWTHFVLTLSAAATACGQGQNKERAAVPSSAALSIVDPGGGSNERDGTRRGGVATIKSDTPTVKTA